MPFNGSGVFQRVRNWVADATAGIKIRADYHDSEDDGFAAGLSNCIAKDGQTLITQNIPFNAKRITGLADPVNPQDASTKAYADTKVSNTGSSTITGDLTLNDPTPYFTLNTVGGVAADNRINGQKEGKLRWMMAMGYGGTEDGSGLGSDFYLYRYTDAGADWGTGPVLTASRLTGRITLGAQPVDPMDVATKQYTDTQVATASSAAAAATATANAAAASAATKVAKGGDSMTGNLALNPSGGIGMGGQVNSLLVTATPGNDAAISFLIPGIWGYNFGLSSDGNFYMGGFSQPGMGYRFWTQKDFSSVPASAEALEALRARVEALESRLP